jgi:hypothetical protein
MSNENDLKQMIELNKVLLAEVEALRSKVVAAGVPDFKQPQKNPDGSLKPLKLDLGCGNDARRNQETGFIGVDIEARPGVDVVWDLTKAPWPWADNSVDEVFASHLVEHLPGMDHELEIVNGKIVKKTIYPRAVFFNEMWRVMKEDAKAMIATPHWASNRAYGDVSHVWPPVSEIFWYSLMPGWRKVNQVHLANVYTCDFLPSVGYAPGPELTGRNPEFCKFALANYKEAAADMLTTLVAKNKNPPKT